MNPLDSEENKENFTETSNLHSNQEIVSIFPHFEAHVAPQSLFSRHKSLPKSKEKPVSLEKTPQNSQHILELHENHAHPMNFSSFYQVFRVFSLCREFIRKLKEKRISQISWKKSFPLEILRDKTYFPDETQQKRGNFLRNLSVFKRFHWKALTISFRKSPINVLDLGFLLINCVVLLEAPLKLANLQDLTLSHNCGSNAEISLQNLSFFACFMVIISGFFQRIPEETNTPGGNPQKKRKFQVNYLLSLDFLAKFSLLVYFLNESCALLFQNTTFFADFRVFTCGFVLVSATTFAEKLKKFEYSLQIARKTQEKLAFFKVNLVIFQIFHNFSCFYLYLSRRSRETAENWQISAENLENEPFSLYISAFSLIIKGISTIPSETGSALTEKLFFIGFFAVFWGLFLVNSGKILQIIKKIDENSRDNSDLLGFLSRDNVKFSTASQIQQFLDKKYKENQRSLEFSIANELNALPVALKSTVFKEKYGEILKKLPYLQHFSANFQKKFLLNLEEKRVFPNEILLRPQEEPCFFLIGQGFVNVSIITDKNEEKVIKTYGKNEVFGEKSLFSLNLPQFSLVAREFAIVKAMKKNEFLKIVRENTADYEKYCFLRDKTQFSAFSSGFSQCEVCKGADHRSFACVYRGFAFKTPHFAANFRFNNSKNMHFSGRKPKKAWNSLKNKEILTRILAKNQVIPPMSLFFQENRSKINESSSIELSDTSLGQMLRRKAKKLTGNHQEKPIEKNIFSKNSKTNSESSITSELFNDKDSSNIKKPELLLEHISEESEIQDTFTIDLEKFSDSVKIEEELLFDQVNEFAHYFTQNNVSKVLSSMKSPKEGIKKNTAKKNKIAIKTTITNKKNKHNIKPQ